MKWLLLVTWIPVLPIAAALDFRDNALTRWHDGAAVRVGPLLVQVTRGQRTELYVKVGRASALVTL